MSALSALVHDAQRGEIAPLDRCQMPDCVCPEGRFYFEASGSWMATADRHPVLGRAGGKYEPGNVRLAHAHCNSLAGGHGAGHRETRRVRREREAEAEA